MVRDNEEIAYMVFDIYSALKEAFDQLAKATKQIKKVRSFAEAFNKAVVDCKENKEIGTELYHKLENNSEYQLKDKIRKALNKSNGSRELETELTNIFKNVKIESDEQEVSYFFSKLFFYLLKTEEYSNKIIAMRADIELSETHRMMKLFLTQSDETMMDMQAPHILTRYMPRKQPELIGRKEDLNKILKVINEKNKIVIVNGMGGIGKTALCRAIFSSRDNTDQLAWVNYTGNLLNDLVEQFYFPIMNKDSTYNDRLDKLLFFLREKIREDAFLVVDNVNSTFTNDQNLHILDSFRCKVICTSRIRDWELFEKYDLDFLSKPECIEMFEVYYRELTSDKEKAEVERIIELAGFHTLTIEAIAKVSLQDGLNPSEILSKLNQKGFNLSEAVAQITHRDETIKELTVIEHLKCVFDISSLDKNEQKVLKILSVFPNMTVPKEIYKWLKLPNKNIFNYLVKYAWLNELDDGYYMHHVIKEVIKNSCKITLNDFKTVISFFVDYLESGEHISVQDYNRILPYVESVANYFTKNNSTMIGELYRAIGIAYYAIGKFTEAKLLLNKSYNILIKRFPNNDINIFNLFSIEASIENCLGNFEESERLYKKAVRSCEESVYSQDIIMADIYRDIGTNYLDLKNTTAAIQYGEKATEIYKKNLAFLELASTYNNLGLSYYYDNNNVKAMNYYKEAEKLYKGKISEEHQDFATLYNNVAMVLCDDEKLEEALQYHLRALAIRNKFENENHIELSQTYNNMATVFYKMKDYKSAIEYQKLDISVLRNINLKHPYLKESYMKMADYYNCLNKKRKAKKYQEMAATF